MALVTCQSYLGKPQEIAVCGHAFKSISEDMDE